LNIIIINNTNPELISDTLDSIKRFTKSPYEIIIFTETPFEIPDNIKNCRLRITENRLCFSNIFLEVIKDNKKKNIVYIESGVIVKENWLEIISHNLNEDTYISAPLLNSNHLKQNYKKYVNLPLEVVLDSPAYLIFGKFKDKNLISKYIDPRCFLISKDFVDFLLKKYEVLKKDFLFFELLKVIHKNGKNIKICLDTVVIDVKSNNVNWDLYGKPEKYKDILRKKRGKDAEVIFEEYFGIEKSREENSKLFSIILPVKNDIEYTRVCLDSIRNNTNLEDGEIIVVDNNSTDNTAEYLATLNWISVIKISEDKGFTSVLNRGINSASGRYIIVLHNDTVVTSGWMDKLIEKFRADSRIAAVGPKSNFAAGTQFDFNANYSNEDQMYEYYDKLSAKYKNQYREVTSLESFCIAFKSEIFEEIGDYDERYGSNGFEDEDISYRINRQGYTLALSEDSYVHHYGDSYFDNNSGKYNKKNSKNLDVFKKKWGIYPDEVVFEDVIKNFNKPLITDKKRELLLNKLFNIANEFASENRLNDAINIYKFILNRNPRQAEVLHNLNILCYRLGLISEAKKGYNLLIKLFPSFAGGYNSLGLIYYNEGKYEDALSLFKKAISLDINFEDAYYNYKTTAEKLGISIYDKADIVFYTSGMPFDGNTINIRGLGGSESAMYYMAKEFAKIGKKVRIFNNCDNPGIYDGVEYGDLADFYIYKKFNKFDIFISSRSFKPFFLGIDAKVKVIWLHDRFNVEYLEGLDFSKLDFSDIKIFTLSKFQTDEWKSELNLRYENFYITRNAINPEFFKKEIKKKRGKLIYSSRPSRGLKILLEIFPEIKKRVPYAELHVFTYALSEKDRELAPMQHMLKQEGVKFHGSVSQRELAENMMEAELLVYPSIFKETSCITAIESQAAGTPVVTTALAALKETVVHGETGILIEGDANSEKYKKEFVNSVVELLQNREKWEYLSKKGKDRTFNIYTWSAVARDWLKEFDNIKMKINPSLSLCMIVKNEEKNLPVALDSVKDIVDEIIIVDTGSTDSTVEVAKSYKAKVYDYVWTGDFSEARNESIKYATGDWILYLDADEKIDEENKEKIRKIIRRKDIDAVNMIEIIPQKEGSLFKKVSTDYCRLFRNKPEYKFVGKVHEQILDSILKNRGKVEKSDIEIIHWGFNISEEKQKEREERNLNLLLEELKSKPKDPFVHFNLGITYKSKNENEKSIFHFKKALKYTGDSLKDELYVIIYTSLSQIYFANSDFDNAEKYSQMALEKNRNEILPFYILAGISFEKEKYENAIEYLLKIEELSKNEDERVYAGDVDIAGVYLDIGNSYFKLSDFRSAVKYYNKSIDHNDNSYDVYFNLGNTYFMLGMFKEAEANYKKSLEINEEFLSAKDNLEKCKLAQKKEI